jgi:drug/metabolite transporter (DMT)-like permease
VLALLAVTVIWGWTFVWMKQCISAGESVLGPNGHAAAIGLFLFLRFGAAALLLPACFPAARRILTREVGLGGLVIGGLILIGFVLQMFGLREVSPPVSAFLTSLYVLFTALIGAAIERRAPKISLLGGALLATFGAAYIGGPPQLTFGLAEWLTVGCAFVFAVHIFATDRITSRTPPLPVSTVTFATAALGGLALLCAGILAPEGPSWRETLALTREPAFVVPLALSTVIATVVAITLMNLFQREIDPLRAAILYAIEPVWASIFAIASGLDTANFWLWVGGGALLLGNLVAEVGLLRRKPAGPSAAAVEAGKSS